MSDKELRTNATQKCPECGFVEWRPLGFSSGFFYIVKCFLMGLFGLIGVLVGNSAMKRRRDDAPFVLKCKNCGKKWKTSPSEAAQEERMEIPCEITINRPKGVVGAAVSFWVFLNGIRVGALKNGGSLNFQTNLNQNILYCVDATGTVFPDYRRFEAEPGGHIDFNFNRKFL